MTTFAARVAERTRERTLPVLMIIAGALLLFLLAFDQGQVLSRLLGDTAYQKNYLHEFFHDARHLLAYACH